MYYARTGSQRSHWSLGFCVFKLLANGRHTDLFWATGNRIGRILHRNWTYCLFSLYPNLSSDSYGTLRVHTSRMHSPWNKSEHKPFTILRTAKQRFWKLENGWKPKSLFWFLGTFNLLNPCHGLNPAANSALHGCSLSTSGKVRKPVGWHKERLKGQERMTATEPECTCAAECRAQHPLTQAQPAPEQCPRPALPWFKPWPCHHILGNVPLATGASCPGRVPSQSLCPCSSWLAGHEKLQTPGLTVSPA